MEPPGSDFETGEDYKGRSTSTLQCKIKYCRRNPNIICWTLLLLFMFLICVSSLSIAVNIGQGGLSKEVSIRLTFLENTVEDITQKFLEEKHRADKLFQQLEQLMVEHHCADVKDVIGQTQTNVSNRVAFSAYLARDLDNLGPDQTVIFENVTLNDGNAYNPLLGTFHVPQAGLYFFTVTLQSFQKRRQWFKLVADRHIQAELLYYPFGHQMATNTAVLRLKEGQTVRVAVSEEENGVSLQNGYTSKFSGFFVNE
ncbi:heavy metal-binding protein HIP-like [Dreissena polymorpha]|uniref:C1q domain-containing protein n=1 Tax=Dreissena polymorpha TaxID=45954 RepID=A0A9D4J7B1_DREPO|nr:heavy metal-binding protein HIP-like [Dreissena polymorpha]KAH3801155.1 hypothetical protein DPMN_154801 [Dreissena polymorpha]